MGQTASDATHAMSRRAEALLRALVGVHQAEVSFHAAGAIARVRVAAAGISSGLLIRNIRSALLAGLGVAVDPLQIELVDPALWTSPRSNPAAAAAQVTVVDAAGAPEVPANAPPQHGSGAPAIGPRNGDGDSSNGNGNGDAHAALSTGDAPARARAAMPQSAATRIGTAERMRAQPRRTDPLLGKTGAKRASAQERAQRDAAVRAEAGLTSRAEGIEVERVDLVRHAGRLRCRVVIAAGPKRFSAIADAADAAGTEIQLAGRVACDALRAGALTGAQFESATIAYLAGRVHVVASLGDWKNGEPAPRSGSAVAGESLEHAAARAVLQAVLAQPA